MLTLNKRQVRQVDNTISFITPEAWSSEPGVRPRYDNMVFERQHRGKDAVHKILGVGHNLVDQAIRHAKSGTASLAALPENVLNNPLAVFRINDQITTSSSPVRAIVAGIEFDPQNPTSNRLLKDWQLVERLNQMSEHRGVRRAKAVVPEADTTLIADSARQAEEYLKTKFEELDLPFEIPVVELWAIFWPVAISAATSDTGDEEQRD